MDSSAGGGNRIPLNFDSGHLNGSKRALVIPDEKEDKIKSVENLIGLINSNKTHNLGQYPSDKKSKLNGRDRAESSEFEMEGGTNKNIGRQGKKYGRSESFEDFKSDSLSEEDDQEQDNNQGPNKTEGPLHTYQGSEKRGNNRSSSQKNQPAAENFVGLY